MGKKLAIKGHSTRGKEVIELLEMMGGHADDLLDNGIDEKYAYFIVNDENNVIDAFPIYKKDEFDFDVQIFTLQEFLEKYPYKVGDTVTVWVEDWENRRGSYVSVKIECVKWDDCRCEIIYVTKVGGMYIFFEAKDVKENMEELIKLSGTVCDTGETISYTVSMKDDKVVDNAIDSAQFMQLGKTVAVCFNTANYENEVELQLGDYEIVVRDGKTYAVLKKPAYPKTYEECVRIAKNIHGYDINIDAPAYRELLESFVKLLICRDAYWKIAGREMGLGKPWEPDWNDQRPKYTITVIGNQLIKHHSLSQNYILAFPTEEMRDAFYENFKDLIEGCKELL